jgi:type VII secretion protein EccB
MHTRRDHVVAHRFAVSRLAAVLVTGRPGTGEPPFRRAGFGTVLGVMAAVLISAALALYGLLDPSVSTAWRKSGSIIVENETGTRFLYQGGVLYPTANYASVLLLAGGTPTVNYVPQSALANIPVGPAIGIPGAPDSLPAASALLPGKWATCLPPGDTGDITLDLEPGNLHAALGDRRVLVSGPGGADWVIFGNAKYRLDTRSGLVALGFGNTDPLPAPAAWLDALPTGRPLVPPAITGAGGPGPEVAGQPTMVGELFDSVAGGVDQHYVLLADGLAPVSPTEFALLAANPQQRAPVRVSPAEIAAMPASADRAMLGMAPGLLAGSVYQPAATAGPGGSQALCAVQSSPGSPSSTTVVTASIGAAGVLIAPGAGMIATTPSAALDAGSGAGGGQSYLITGSGEKYPLAGDAQTDLGYGNAAAQVVPAGVLALLATGPELSPVSVGR